MSTLICTPIMIRDIDAARAEALLAVEHGADAIEWRVDGLWDPSPEPEHIESVQSLIASSPVACILTCRPEREGGMYTGSDAERANAMRTVANGDAQPDYIDIELDSLQRDPAFRALLDELESDHEQRPRVILSSHDFAERPPDLTRRMVTMASERAAAVHKVAFRARSLRDNLELFDLLHERAKPTIALGMGIFGLMSRVLAPKFGAMLTFASLRDESATAPGQPTLKELLGLYRFREITPRTRVYGVVGWPLGHSASPIMHNAGFEAVGHDGVYLPLPIAVGDADTAGAFESFKATMLELVHSTTLDFSGCSVTLPHKEHLVQLARSEGWEMDGISAQCGAANTLVIDRDINRAPTRCRIMNTDAAAGVAQITNMLAGLDGTRVAIIGAGGVARALAAAIVSEGAELEVYARTETRASALAAAAQDWSRRPVIARSLDELAHSTARVVINCTPVGMTGTEAQGESPVPVDLLSDPDRVFFDTVYNPVETPMLKQAREHGCKVIDGLGMLVGQAAIQFEHWTGNDAPVEQLAHAARTYLQES